MFHPGHDLTILSLRLRSSPHSLFFQHMVAVLVRELGNEISKSGLELIITHRVHIMVEGHELVRIELLVVQLRLEDELVACRLSVWWCPPWQGAPRRASHRDAVR